MRKMPRRRSGSNCQNLQKRPAGRDGNDKRRSVRNILQGLTVPTARAEHYVAYCWSGDQKPETFTHLIFRRLTNVASMPLFGLKPAGLLQTMFENIGAAVAVIDLQGNFVFANQTALDMFALGRSDSLVRFTDWRHNYQVEDSLGREIRVDDSAIMRALRGERVASQEVRVKFPDGSTKWLLIW